MQARTPQQNGVVDSLLNLVPSCMSKFSHTMPLVLALIRTTSWIKFAKLYILVNYKTLWLVHEDFFVYISIGKGNLHVQMIKFPLTLCNKSHTCFYSSPFDYWCKALLIPSCYSHPRTTRCALYVGGMLSIPFILNTHLTLIKDFLDKSKSTRLYLSCFCQCSSHILLLYTIFYIWKLL